MPLRSADRVRSRLALCVEADVLLSARCCCAVPDLSLRSPVLSVRCSPAFSRRYVRCSWVFSERSPRFSRASSARSLRFSDMSSRWSA